MCDKKIGAIVFLAGPDAGCEEKKVLFAAGDVNFTVNI